MINLLPAWIYHSFGLSFILILVIDLVCRYVNFHHLIHQKVIFLELTPPTAATKTPLATSQFFTILHTATSTLSWWEKLLGRRYVFSLEVVSSRSYGIRYYIRIPKRDAALFQQQITAYLPDIQVKRIKEYHEPSLSNPARFKISSFKQAQHFILPLAHHSSLKEHDPIAYITGSMTKLSPSEAMALQIVLSPSDSHLATEIRRDMQIGRTPRLSRVNWPFSLRLLAYLIRLPIELLRIILSAIGAVLLSSSQPSRQYTTYASNRPVLTNSTQAIIDSIDNKLSEPLFEASIRTFVVGEDKFKVKQINKGLSAALQSLKVIGYQSLKPRKDFPSGLKPFLRLYSFNNRLPAIFSSNSSLLATSEVASLFHFPYSGKTKAENVVTSLSRTLPAPTSLKDGSPLDVLIGENSHQGSVTAIGLSKKERERHMYVIGGTGNGKTTMLSSMIIQDIRSGKGVAVIDPHGDLAQELLTHIPDERMQDVVYFNPDDLAHPIGLNLLEIDPRLSGDELIREKDLITESVVSLFRKIFSEDGSGGHRVEYVLRNTVQTALTVPDATLFTIYDLLNDKDYLRSVLRTLDNEDLLHFWKNELGKAGDMQKVKMAAGITAKVGRFLFSAAAKRILEQPRSTIDFDDIINSGKILICNFSKGLIGEDTSELFGVAVLAKLQLVSLRRARLTHSQRHPFYLYVDEFQNFATVSFVEMLSESRKYKLYLTMAEQSTSQQADPQMVNTILANAGTVITFRTGNPADETLLLPLFRPYIDRGEIMNLSSYHFYARFAAVHSQEPLSGTTVVPEAGLQDAARIIARSRETYGRPYLPVHRERRSAAALRPPRPANQPQKRPRLAAHRGAKP